MEHSPTHSPESDIPQEAGPLADWIDDELGDEELAQFLREHPEGFELCANGESILPRTVFELAEDISQANEPKFLGLLRHMDADGMLPEFSGDRIVGNVTERARENLHLHRGWLVAARRAGLREGEREKTEEELAMIDHANSAIDTLRARFGLPSFRVPSEAVQFVDDIPSVDDRIVGDFAQFKQESRVTEGDSLLREMAITLHEMTHHKSYGAVVVRPIPDTNEVEPATYRTGMNIYSRDGKKKYLTSLNEAVTEETANRLLSMIPGDHPILGAVGRRHRGNTFRLDTTEREEVEKRRWKSYWMVPLSAPNEKGERLLGAAYAKERNVMEDLFDKLYERNPERFFGQTREDAREALFVMLQKAMFTGNILPFGRLFNNTFGHGKFREYGHLQTVEEQQEFLTSL